jgi:hypothetical protein
METVAYLPEHEPVDAHSCIQQQWWQEHVEEQLPGRDAQPYGKAVAKRSKVHWEGNSHQHRTCTAATAAATAASYCVDMQSCWACWALICGARLLPIARFQ